ncbi:MAG: hypothetical protein Q8O16_04295, partial [Dehalococcoidia bacterium]|nr:hypothetical protein [Dehalococcoidia bacterium]
EDSNSKCYCFRGEGHLYYIGMIAGGIGIIGFAMAFVRAIREDGENKAMRKKAEDDFRSAMKSMQSIHGELQGLREDVKKRR